MRIASESLCLNRVVISFRFYFGDAAEKVVDTPEHLICVIFVFVRIYCSSHWSSYAMAVADNSGFQRLSLSEFAFAVLVVATYCVRGSLDPERIRCFTICNDLRTVVGCLAPRP